MQTEHAIRYATPEDAERITEHRHRMFRDNEFAVDDVLARMDEAFLPWVRERLRDGRYLGLLVEQAGEAVAGAGVFFGEFPPHWRHTEPVRAYVLNVYTEPEARGQGLAKRLMAAVLEECRRRGVSTVVLHASPQGRPIYEAMGFVVSDEMLLSLAD
jgi:GNAT superfamily N-acetyltransferase